MKAVLAGNQVDRRVRRVLADHYESGPLQPFLRRYSVLIVNRTFNGGRRRRCQIKAKARDWAAEDCGTRHLVVAEDALPVWVGSECQQSVGKVAERLAHKCRLALRNPGGGVTVLTGDFASAVFQGLAQFPAADAGLPLNDTHHFFVRQWAEIGNRQLGDESLYCVERDDAAVPRQCFGLGQQFLDRVQWWRECGPGG